MCDVKSEKAKPLGHCALGCLVVMGHSGDTKPYVLKHMHKM